MRLTLLQVRNVMNFNNISIIISFDITKANLIVAAQMTFGKHIERKHICFFPGEVRLLFLIALKPDCLSYFADFVCIETPNNQISKALSWQK